MIILTKRKVMQNKANNKKYCFDIVYEWEDIYARVLEANIKKRSDLEFKFDEVCRKIYKKKKLPLYRIFPIFDTRKNNIVFMYDAAKKRQDGIYNSKKYVPCLIDYFLSEEDYPLFVNAYRRNQLVLVSSREVYEYLLEKKCPLKLAHLPLSIPDNCLDFSERYTKKYDLVLFARQNPLLMEYVDRYEETHGDFSLIRRKYEDGHYIYYESKTNKVISLGDTREDYWNLVKASRVALYTTPGMDGTRQDANGWNQVTPHFLEELAGQCHIIARYPENADTRWYQMDTICDCVQSYEEFEKKMDSYRKLEVDLNKYANYLKKHVTSERAYRLKNIINNL